MKFTIKKWSAWAPELETPEDWRQWSASGATLTQLQGDNSPKLHPVPAMQRRRMSRLSKMALQVAYDCSGENTQLRTVFASRHGELHRTTKILHELFDGEGVSPTAFSLSVHNASSGLYSIARKAPAPTSSVAAGTQSFIAGLLEALGFLLQGEQGVMLVFAEEPLPLAYQSFADEDQASFALALWLELAGEGDVHEISPIKPQSEKPSQNLNGASLPQALVWLDHFLKGTPKFVLEGKREQWSCGCR